MHVIELFRRGKRKIDICCQCGDDILEDQTWVTVVAAPFDRLRAHKSCHDGDKNFVFRVPRDSQG